MNCWGKASLGLPRLGEAWFPCWPTWEAPEQTRGGAGEGRAVPGRHRGRGKTLAAKGSFHESAKGSTKGVNELLLASPQLLLFQMPLHSFRVGEQKSFLCVQAEQTETAVFNTLVHQHTHK